MRDVLHVSERRACRAPGQHRSTQRKVPRGRADEAALTADPVALAEQYGRYGYWKVGALLKAAGWVVNAKRGECIWRREGLRVPARQPKRGRLWDGDGSCIRVRPDRRDHVWSYDVGKARPHDGSKFRMLDVIDEINPGMPVQPRSMRFDTVSVESGHRDGIQGAAIHR